MPDWFRCTEWNEQTETEFFRRLGRARRKAEYLRVQAVTLVQTGRPDLATPALKLVEMFLEEEGEPLWRNVILDIKARALVLLERWDEGYQAFEEALSAQRARQTAGNGDVWLQYPLTIARRRDRKRYQRALEILKEFVAPSNLLFPLDQFKDFATIALISADEGDLDGARRWARNALAATAKKAPFSRHPDVGLVGEAYGDLRAELVQLADDGESDH